MPQKTRLCAALLATLIASACLPATALSTEELTQQVEAVQAHYVDVGKTGEELVLEGDTAGANRKLTELVPDASKTEADYFILGNMLFTIDPDASYHYMKKAEALDPANTLILYERGIHEHRLGNFAAAASYYEKLHQSESGAKNDDSWAYLTHCYLRLQRPDDALAAWRHVDIAHRRLKIDEAMYEILGDPNPSIKRATLIPRAKNGDLEAFYELVQLDQNWELNWWNVFPRKAFLEHDLQYADSLFKNKDQDRRMFALVQQIDTMDKGTLAAQLEALGLWGEHKKLPEPATAAYEIIRHILSTGLGTPDDILRAYEADLIADRIKAPNDIAYIDLLSYLYAATHQSEKLSTLDQYGWHTLKLPRYAASHVNSFRDRPVEFSRTLRQAAQDFPNDAYLTSLYADNQKGSADELAAVTSMVAAKFANVGKPTNAAGLNFYMGYLYSKLSSLARKPPAAGSTTGI